MNKQFELIENNEIFYGVIENIPEDITLEEIKNRIEVFSVDATIQLLETEVTNPDIIFDWTSIDYNQEMDRDFSDVSDILYLAAKKNVIDEVVYLALKNMKENSELSISDAMNNSFNDCI